MLLVRVCNGRVGSRVYEHCGLGREHAGHLVERTLRAADSTLDRDAADAVINELDDYAIEEGLRLQEAHGGDEFCVDGPGEGRRRDPQGALSMGASRQCTSPTRRCAARTASLPPRYWLTCSASRIRRGDPGLRVNGHHAWARSPPCWPSGLASRSCSFRHKVEINGTAISSPAGRLRLRHRRGEPPQAVVGVMTSSSPSFKGIMSAKKKPVGRGLADLTDASDAGLAASATEVVSFAKRPPRTRPRHPRPHPTKATAREGRRVPRGPQDVSDPRLLGRLPTNG